MPNTAPSIVNLSSAFSVSEQEAFLISPDIDFVDAELDALGSYAGAQLIIQRAGGANPDDIFTFDPGLLAAAGITITGVPPVMTPDIGTSSDGNPFGTGGFIAITFHAGATPALVDALLQTLTYQNVSDNPPSSVLIRFSFVDGDLIGALTAEQDVTINLTGLNDAPAPSGDLAAEISEGGSYTLTLADLGATDPDNEPFQITFSVTGQSNGEIRVGGLPAATFTAQAIADGLVAFVHDGSETSTASFSVDVADLDGPGVPAGATVAFSVAPQNSPPQFVGADISVRQMLEQGSPLVLASSGSGLLTISDADFDGRNGGAGNYAGGEILVEVTNDSGPSLLSFNTMASVTRVGNELRVSGVTIATITETASSLSVVFTDANGTIPTRDLANEVLQAIWYSNTSDNPQDLPSVTITFLDHDPVLPEQTQTGFQIEILPLNDAPTLTGDLTGVVLQGGTRVLAPSDLFFTDPDDGPANITFNVTFVAGGEVRVAGLAQSSFTAADIEAGLVSFVHDGTGGPTAEFGFDFDDLDQDGSGPSGGTLTLTVDPTDDAPVLTSGGGASAWTVTADENSTQRLASLNFEALDNFGLVIFDFAQLSTAVATVTAADPEEGPVTYSIVGGLDAALFSLSADTLLTEGSSTGSIYFRLPAGAISAANFEVPADDNGDGVYEIVIEASDGANTVTQAVSIQVQGTDEAPRFAGSLPARLASVASGTASVGSITASDDDGTAVTYALSGGGDQGLFAIDSGTGALSFVMPPTYGASGSRGPNFYEVVVAATSGAQTSEQTVLVRVTNPSNTAPVIDGFAGDTLAVTRGENQVGDGFYLLAHDGQGQSSGNGFLWEVISVANGGGADAALFTIDPATGLLQFINLPDHEAPTDAGANNVYDVTVRLTDEYGAGLSDQEALSITIGPATNTAPTITGLSLTTIDAFNTGYLENFPYPLDNVVQAIDPEGQTSGNGLVWEIVSVANGGAADADDFIINASTGALRFAAQPDFEAPTDSNLDNTYQITIRVTDNNGAGLSDQQLITVHVIDVDEGGGGSNTDPTLTGLDTTRNVTPQGGAILVDTNVAVADAELDAASGGQGNYANARLTVQRVGGVAGVDEIGLNLALLASSGITSSVSILEHQGLQIAHQTDSAVLDASSLLDITFDVGATSALVDAVIQAITYRLNSSSTTPFALEYRFEDGAGGVVTDTIDINPGTGGGGGNADLITTNGGRTNAIIATIENSTRVMTFTADTDNLPRSFSLDGGADAGLFAIDAQTGVLTFNGAPDYETPADADGDNVYDVIVRVDTTGIAAGLFDTQQLSIAIADIPGLVLNGTNAANTLTGSVEGDILNGNGGNDTLVGNGSFDTLNGGLGSDTASYANATGIVLADLNLGGAGAPGHGLDQLIDIENVIGGNFGDTLVGNALANRLIGGLGNDTLDGGGGADVLTGGRGKDSLTGGLGADDFDFDRLNEMGKAALTRDVITDFAIRSDDIDLRTLDASTKLGGNQAFTFIGTQKFHKVAGELHYVKAAGNTVVEGDTNGDGKADFQIELTGVKNLAAGDFVL